MIKIALCALLLAACSHAPAEAPPAAQPAAAKPDGAEQFLLVKGVLQPWERRPLQVTCDAPFPGVRALGSGLIRVFYAGGGARTLTVREGDAVEV